ncbi:hypothetical protein INT45_006767 [Circinella minor]|uniref:Uncharacterized protein n=1 Tax=Circinella minor TaxID=1195481 RepID=A0A8H7S9V5_9FUNG|nr:hypothetical protein INT45_006767 [Circinella minor]
MLTIALTPGPLSVKDLWSFLGPTMKDLDDLATKGIKIEIGKENIMVKAHLLGVTGDIPAIKTLANVQSHTSFFGCRICPLPGIHDENGFGMYFNDVDNEYNMEWKTKKEFLEGTESGIVGPCKFAHLDTFLSAEFFTGDEMHMIGHGISHQFYDLLIGQYNLKTEWNKAHENPFQIDNIAEVLESIDVSRKKIPSEFTGDWANVSGILLLKTSDARKAAMSLVRACQTALSYSITRQQVNVVESDIKEWHSYLRTLINSQILSVSVFTPNQHYLSHVPELIRRMGPMVYYSCRCLERMVGVYSNLLRKSANPSMDVNKYVRNLAIGPYIDTVCGTTNNKEPSKYVYYVDDCNQDAAEIHGKLKKADMNAMIQDLGGVNGGELKRAMISYNRQNGRNVTINTSFKYGQRMWIGETYAKGKAQLMGQDHNIILVKYHFLCNKAPTIADEDTVMETIESIDFVNEENIDHESSQFSFSFSADTARVVQENDGISDTDDTDSESSSISDGDDDEMPNDEEDIYQLRSIAPDPIVVAAATETVSIQPKKNKTS